MILKNHSKYDIIICYYIIYDIYDTSLSLMSIHMLILYLIQEI